MGNRNRDPSALGILIYPFLFYSVLFIAFTIGIGQSYLASICILIWLVFFLAIMVYDRRHWGAPGPETHGVWLSSQTRNLELGEYSMEGVVMGTCVKTRNLFSAARAESRSIVGGEALQFTSLVEECRNIALGRMCKQARSIGCNGVIGYRMISAETLWGATEIIAYGTAVRIRGVDNVNV